MRKILATVLALCMVAGLLAACGNSAPATTAAQAVTTAQNETTAEETTEAPTVTEAATTEEQTTEAVDEDGISLTVTIDGAEYTFPCKLSDFEANGWVLSDWSYTDSSKIGTLVPTDSSIEIPPAEGGTELNWLSLTKGDYVIDPYFVNRTDNTLALKDCDIYGIWIEGTPSVFESFGIGTPWEYEGFGVGTPISVINEAIPALTFDDGDLLYDKDGKFICIESHGEGTASDFCICVFLEGHDMENANSVLR